MQGMTRTLNRLWHKRGRRSAPQGRERGQSLVEVAVVLPILLLLLAVVVDAARAFDAYIVLTNAVREGARFGSLQLVPEPVDVELLVINDVLGSGTNISHMEGFTYTNVSMERTNISSAVTVTVSYDFPLWFGGLVGVDTFHLEKTSVMPKYKAEAGP